MAVLAVDPVSKRSGGSLLGDRARIEHDPGDDGVLIRSTAAGARLGGLAAPTREAADALAAAFDVVVVETVGVGQSETDVADVCDTVAVVVQPASGDVLQFLKAGIMEVPDVLVVTKADLGDAAGARSATSRRRSVRSGRADAGAGGLVGGSADGIGELAARSTHTARGSTSRSAAARAARSALREFGGEHGERACARSAAAARPSGCWRRGPGPGRERAGRAPRGGGVSRRRRSADARPARGRPQPSPSRPRAGPGGAPGVGTRDVVAVVLGVFVVVSLIAWAAGAANLGVALGIGQVAFAVALVAVMVWRSGWRRGRRRRSPGVQRAGTSRPRRTV